MYNVFQSCLCHCSFQTRVNDTMSCILRASFHYRHCGREVCAGGKTPLYLAGYSVAGHKKQYAAASSFKHYSSQWTDNAKYLLPLYHGALTNRIRRIKYVTLCTSTLAIIFQPFLLHKMGILGDPTPAIAACVFFLLYSISTPLLVHFITKKYITSVYYDTERDKYIATTYNLLARKKMLEFTPSDVMVPAVIGMFATVLIKGKPYFWDINEFEDLEHYKRIMSFDKPIDFYMPQHNGTAGITSENKIENKQ